MYQLLLTSFVLIQYIDRSKRVWLVELSANQNICSLTYDNQCIYHWSDSGDTKACYWSELGRVLTWRLAIGHNLVMYWHKSLLLVRIGSSTDTKACYWSELGQVLTWRLAIGQNWVEYWHEGLPLVRIGSSTDPNMSVRKLMTYLPSVE